MPGQQGDWFLSLPSFSETHQMSQCLLILKVTFMPLLMRNNIHFVAFREINHVTHVVQATIRIASTLWLLRIGSYYVVLVFVFSVSISISINISISIIALTVIVITFMFITECSHINTDIGHHVLKGSTST